MAQPLMLPGGIGRRGEKEKAKHEGQHGDHPLILATLPKNSFNDPMPSRVLACKEGFGEKKCPMLYLRSTKEIPTAPACPRRMGGRMWRRNRFVDLRTDDPHLVRSPNFPFQSLHAHSGLIRTQIPGTDGGLSRRVLVASRPIQYIGKRTAQAPVDHENSTSENNCTFRSVDPLPSHASFRLSTKPGWFQGRSALSIL